MACTQCTKTRKLHFRWGFPPDPLFPPDSLSPLAPLSPHHEESIMTSLTKYLASLNTTSNWHIYVNRYDLNDYRCSQYELDFPFVCIGTAEKLSFGFQSDAEAIESYLDGFSVGNGKSAIAYSDRKVIVNRDAILEAFSNGNLDDSFQAFLLEEIASIQQEWANNEADQKVEEIREYLAEGGEYDQEQAELQLAYDY